MNWLICISGYKQKSNRLHGVAKLWAKLGKYRSPSTHVMLYEWDADWEKVAQQIAILNDGPRINIAAFSWGAGWGAIQLCSELLDSGLQVEHLSLCDPIYRNRLAPWMALLTWFRPYITIPPNVRQCDYFVQRTARPMGFLIRGHTGTKINDPVLIKDCEHTFMDEQYEWHNNVLKHAARLVNPA